MSVESPTAPIGGMLNICGPTIELAVGKDAVKLSVHENVLRPRSAYFDGVLSERKKEDSEKPITLPWNATPATVTLYIQHLYTGKINLHLPKSSENISEQWKRIASQHTALAHLYVLGEQLQDSIFKNAVIQAIIARIRFPIDGWFLFPSLKDVDTLYKGTSKGSLARQLMVDMDVMFALNWWMDGPSSDHNKEFLIEVTSLLYSDRETRKRADVLPYYAEHLSKVNWTVYLEKTGKDAETAKSDARKVGLTDATDKDASNKCKGVFSKLWQSMASALRPAKKDAKSDAMTKTMPDKTPEKLIEKVEKAPYLRATRTELKDNTTAPVVVKTSSGTNSWEQSVAATAPANRKIDFTASGKGLGQSLKA
ncbi:hypothetical protein LTR17_024986 [Elasticomyces elasticus]|nr:hypothetical protein LTR17_024986 [Elasticomyces elasticus]